MLRKLIKKIRKARDNESGQAVVEFALVLPLLLILIMGILDFGWIFVNQYHVEKASSAAVRYGSMNVSRYKDTDTRQTYLNGVKDKAVDNLPDEGGNVICVDETAGSRISGEGTTVVRVNIGRNSVSVTVTYPVRTLTFVAGAIFGRYYSATSTSVSSY